MSELKPKYGEPWRPGNDHPHHGCVVNYKVNGDPWHFFACGAEHAARICACVNAFAGVDDPAAEIEDLKSLHARLMRVAKAINDDNLASELDFDDYRDHLLTVLHEGGLELWRAKYFNAEAAAARRLADE